ncbi:MAG: M23 family metallopeptidase [Ferruginibacter sp.]|nr:M23 family metallopeptidase [Cytophagales bacterium]
MRTLFLPVVAAVLGALFLTGCGGVKTLRQALRAAPYEKYAESLRTANLEKTALGQDWLTAGRQALRDSLLVALPFRETGYFAADQPGAVGYWVPTRRGEKLVITVATQARQPMRVFVDVFDREPDDQQPGGFKLRRVAYADSAGRTLEYEPKRDGTHLIRLQPELLRSGQYTVSIQNQPSLGFPVRGKGNSAVQSLFGVPRDGGRRIHEGVDIFAPRRTPVVAVSEGYVTGVNENQLGGKVVWLQDEERRITLYYAHLDSQLVRTGQPVQPGDTVGLVGNTGNARYTPSHLHFGIYTGEGVVDPYPFIRQATSPFKTITADLSRLGEWTRTSVPKSNVRLAPEPKATSLGELPKHAPLQVWAGAGGWYRVATPDGRRGYVAATSLEGLARPVRTVSLAASAPLFDFPDFRAASLDSLAAGTSVSVLAVSGSFQYVRTPLGKLGWLAKE